MTHELVSSVSYLLINEHPAASYSHIGLTLLINMSYDPGSGLSKRPG